MLAPHALQPVIRFSRLSNLRKFEPWREFAGQFFIRWALWDAMSRNARHPVAWHLRQQLRRGRTLPVLPLATAFATVLLFLITYAYTLIDHALVWTLPLWLMLFSTFYCAIWIARIVALMSRQTRDGVLDEVSVIPPGPVFIYLTICKVVLNDDDAIFWLSLLRRILAGMIFIGLVMSLCIVLTQIDDIRPDEFLAILVELFFIALVILLEHSQSVVLACLLSIEVCNHLHGSIDKTSVSVTSFVLLQIMSYSLALAVVVALNAASLTVVLVLFLLIRELLISVLWRRILWGANAESTKMMPDRWRESLTIDSQYGQIQ